MPQLPETLLLAARLPITSVLGMPQHASIFKSLVPGAGSHLAFLAVWPVLGV